MGDCKACVAPEAKNGSERGDGKLTFPNMIYHTDTGGAGLVSIRGSKNCITQVVGNAGGGVVSFSPSKSGLGNGTETPKDARDTKSFASQTGDASRPTITSVANPDGTGITLDSGGGRSPTMHMSTPDGLCSITMTSAGGGSITLRVGSTELVVNGAKAQVEVTKQVIREKPDHKAELEKYRKDINDSLRNAMKPYSDQCENCGGSGQQSGSS